MNTVKITEQSDPVFLVLPSIFVEIDRDLDVDEFGYFTLEPYYGKYKVELINSEAKNHGVFIYSGKKVRKDGHIYSMGEFDGKYVIYDVVNHNILKSSITQNIDDIEFCEDWPGIVRFGNKQLCILKNLEFVEYEIYYPNHTMISDNNIIKSCRGKHITDTDKSLYYWDNGHIMRFDILTQTTSHVAKSTDDGYYIIGKNWLVVNEPNREFRPTLMNAENLNTINIQLPEAETIINGSMLMFRSLVKDEPENEYLDLFLIDDGWDESVSVIGEPSSLYDFGRRMLKITVPLIMKYFHPAVINENPFKTEERDRLALWLYNQFGQLLPIPVAGIITEYCTLVKHYMYDVLMNYVAANVKN
jgi:hypothetical protein